ncbi:hypothetical protein RUND412_011158 [Rhizina undulata]
MNTVRRKLKAAMKRLTLNSTVRENTMTDWNFAAISEVEIGSYKSEEVHDFDAETLRILTPYDLELEQIKARVKPCKTFAVKIAVPTAHSPPPTRPHSISQNLPAVQERCENFLLRSSVYSLSEAEIGSCNSEEVHDFNAETPRMLTPYDMELEKIKARVKPRKTFSVKIAVPTPSPPTIQTSSKLPLDIDIHQGLAYVPKSFGEQDALNMCITANVRPYPRTT